jgi:hypothetical protein
MKEAKQLLDSGAEPGDPYARKIGAAIAMYTNIIVQDKSYPRMWTMRGCAEFLGIQYFDPEYLDASFENYDAALSDLNRALGVCGASRLKPPKIA